MDRLAAARSILQAAETRTGVRTAADATALPPALRPLLPAGLPRGGAVQVSGSRTILWALCAAVMGERGWCVVIGLPDVGWYAAKQAGIDLDRVIYLPKGATPPVLAAAIDGADAVVLGAADRIGAGDHRSLAGRLRNRGITLLSTGPWPGAVRIEAEVTQASGCADGAGYMNERVIRARQGPSRVTLAAGAQLRAHRPLAVVS